jgi:hypothetical protein
LAFHLANHLQAALMILVLAVAEVQAEHVGTGGEERLDGLKVVAGRPEGGYDLGMLAWPHFSGSFVLRKGSHGRAPRADASMPAGRGPTSLTTYCLRAFSISP